MRDQQHERIAETVRLFFDCTSGSECIEQLNYLLADYVNALNQIRVMGGTPPNDLSGLVDITFHTTRTATLISKLQEIVQEV